MADATQVEANHALIGNADVTLSTAPESVKKVISTAKELRIPNSPDAKANFDALREQARAPLEEVLPQEQEWIQLRRSFGLGKASKTETKPADMLKGVVDPEAHKSFDNANKRIDAVRDVMIYTDILRLGEMDTTKHDKLLREKTGKPTATWDVFKTNALKQLLDESGLRNVQVMKDLVDDADKLRLLEQTIAKDPELLKKLKERIGEALESVKQLSESPIEKARKTKETADTQKEEAKKRIKAQMASLFSIWKRPPFVGSTAETTLNDMLDTAEKAGLLSNPAALSNQMRSYIFGQYPKLYDVYKYKKVEASHANATVLFAQLGASANQAELASNANPSNKNLEAKWRDLEKKFISQKAIVDKYEVLENAYKNTSGLDRARYDDLTNYISIDGSAGGSLESDINELSQSHQESSAASKIINGDERTGRLVTEEQRSKRLGSAIHDAAWEIMEKSRDDLIKGEEKKREESKKKMDQKLDKTLHGTVSRNNETLTRTIDLDTISERIKFLTKYADNQGETRLLMKLAKFDISKYKDADKYNRPYTYETLPIEMLDDDDKARLEELTTSYQEDMVKTLVADTNLALAMRNNRRSVFDFLTRKWKSQARGSMSVKRRDMKDFNEKYTGYDTTFMATVEENPAAAKIMEDLEKKKIEKGTTLWRRELLRRLANKGTDMTISADYLKAA